MAVASEVPKPTPAAQNQLSTAALPVDRSLVDDEIEVDDAVIAAR